MSRSDASKMIDRAIAKGVPMFNHGNPSGTAVIYKRAAETLLQSADLSFSEQMRLQRGLRASDHSGNARESAWQLRYALDDVQATMSATREMVASERAMTR